MFIVQVSKGNERTRRRNRSTLDAFLYARACGYAIGQNLGPIQTCCAMAVFIARKNPEEKPFFREGTIRNYISQEAKKWEDAETLNGDRKAFVIDVQNKIRKDLALCISGHGEYWRYEMNADGDNQIVVRAFKYEPTADERSEMADNCKVILDGLPDLTNWVYPE